MFFLWLATKDLQKIMEYIFLSMVENIKTYLWMGK